MEHLRRLAEPATQPQEALAQRMARRRRVGVFPQKIGEFAPVGASVRLRREERKDGGRLRTGFIDRGPFAGFKPSPTEQERSQQNQRLSPQTGSHGSNVRVINREVQKSDADIEFGRCSDDRVTRGWEYSGQFGDLDRETPRRPAEETGASCLTARRVSHFVERQMIELILIVCLDFAPEQCEERSLLHMPGVTVMGCMMQAQPQIAQWSEAHPNLTVTRWSCRDVARRRVEA